jgi:hypothetical protein
MAYSQPDANSFPHILLIFEYIQHIELPISDSLENLQRGQRNRLSSAVHLYISILIDSNRSSPDSSLAIVCVLIFAFPKPRNMAGICFAYLS